MKIDINWYKLNENTFPHQSYHKGCYLMIYVHSFLLYQAESVLWQTCRKPPPISDSPVFSGSVATVSHIGRLRDPEPSLPPSLPSFLVFSPHWQISGRESWIFWRWCFGEHFNFVNLLSWSSWDQILTNQSAVSELRRMSTNERQTFCQDSSHVIERLKSVICQMFMMLSDGGNEMISLLQAQAQVQVQPLIVASRRKSSHHSWQGPLLHPLPARCSHNSQVRTTRQQSQQSPGQLCSLCSPVWRTWWPISSPGTSTFFFRVFFSGIKRQKTSDIRYSYLNLPSDWTRSV